MPQPVDTMLREILGQVVFLVVRRLDLVGILNQPRLPLRRLSGEKPKNNQSRGPVGQRSNGPIDVVWVRRRVVPFADRRGLVT